MSWIKDTQKKNVKTRKRIFKNPYLNFMTEFREEMKDKNVEPKEMMKLAGQKWRKMTVDQKHPFIQAALKAKRHRRSVIGKTKRISKNRKTSQNASRHYERHSPIKSVVSGTASRSSKSETSMATSDDN